MTIRSNRAVRVEEFATFSGSVATLKVAGANGVVEILTFSGLDLATLATAAFRAQRTGDLVGGSVRSEEEDRFDFVASPTPGEIERVGIILEAGRRTFYLADGLGLAVGVDVGSFGSLALVDRDCEDCDKRALLYSLADAIEDLEV